MVSDGFATIQSIPASRQPRSDESVSVLAPQEQGRADLYALIGGLLLSPGAGMLARLADPTAVQATQPAHALGAALWALSGAARQLGAQGVAREFDALFVSAGMPLLNPYESFYLTGFMMEKPLAALRGELAALGLARVADARELEDHLGALCETMALLIFGDEPLTRQQAFFETHLLPWQGRFLDELRACPGASFYRHLAELAALFFEIETEAFEIGQTEHPGPALQPA